MNIIRREGSPNTAVLEFVMGGGIGREAVLGGAVLGGTAVAAWVSSSKAVTMITLKTWF